MDADVDADVGDDVDHDAMMTSPLTRSLTRPDQPPDPDIDPTRSTVNDPTRTLTRPRSTTRPDQRSTPDPVNSDPVNSPAACATRCHTRRTFWWRVRARVRVFLGNPYICKLVLKFSTMWYIHFACLKLLQI